MERGSSFGTKPCGKSQAAKPTQIFLIYTWIYFFVVTIPNRKFVVRFTMVYCLRVFSSFGNPSNIPFGPTTRRCFHIWGSQSCAPVSKSWRSGSPRSRSPTRKQKDEQRNEQTSRELPEWPVVGPGRCCVVDIFDIHGYRFSCHDFGSDSLKQKAQTWCLCCSSKSIDFLRGCGHICRARNFRINHQNYSTLVRGLRVIVYYQATFQHCCRCCSNSLLS